MKLVKPNEDDGPGIWGVVKNRKSLREFSDKSISLSELSQLLWAATGITHETRGHKARAAPSAGGLYPIETYVVVNNVDKVDKGVYHYDVENHELNEVKKGDMRDVVMRAAIDQEQTAMAAVVFIWTIVFERTARKYGERSSRYVFMDAGHVCGNLLLAAEALGLGGVPMAAFDDESMNLLVGVDGKKEFAAYLASVGKK